MAMAAGPEYPAGQRSRRSSPSKGKPCTWRRGVVSNFNTNKRKREIRYEKSRDCIKHIMPAQ